MHYADLTADQGTLPSGDDHWKYLRHPQAATVF